MFKKEEVINNEIKICVGGQWKRSYILQSLSNQKSPDRCWKIITKELSRESFFSLHGQLPPYTYSSTLNKSI